MTPLNYSEGKGGATEDLLKVCWSLLSGIYVMAGLVWATPLKPRGRGALRHEPIEKGRDLTRSLVYSMHKPLLALERDVLMPFVCPKLKPQSSTY